MFCFVGGKPFVDQLNRVAKDAKAVIDWRACASYVCVQAAAPNPAQATPVHKVIADKLTFDHLQRLLDGAQERRERAPLPIRPRLHRLF